MKGLSSESDDFFFKMEQIAREFVCSEHLKDGAQRSRVGLNDDAEGDEDIGLDRHENLHVGGGDWAAADE